MPEPGGPAAIHGILYQILANLWRVSEIRLDAELDGQEIRSARVILEPKGGGGDTRYEGEGVRIIEQYKTRGHNRTWSLRELIEDVLPDLFVAVDPDRLTEVSTYRFVTEGRCGGSVHSPNFQRFLACFKSKPTPEDLLGALDDTQAHHFFKQGNFTDRTLFLHISARVRPRGDQTEDALHHYKVWHLLAGFEICDRMSASNLIQNIDAFLIQVVDQRDDVDVKRRELCTILMELSSQGHFACTPEEILQHARLNAIALSAFGKLKARLRSLAEEKFRREGYAGEKDVRGVPEWPSACSILVLMGESGQGKTWQLFRLADHILASDRLAVIVGATGNADGDLQKASDRVWREGLNHDAPLDISRLAARRAEVLKPPPADEDWLTVCIDDVQEIGEARQLVRQPWKRWGIRLALTVPTVVGKAFAADPPEGVYVLEVPDFTPKETRDCLARRGYDWGEIPDDVRATLRRPILAELYCKVAGTEGWAPHNEYEIYERFWQRVTNERDQPDHPSDRGILLQLVGSVIKEDAPYPWPQDFWQHLGLSDEALRRLESIGWLRRGRRGDVEIWHDRLLNWAVAEWLIDQRRTNQIKPTKLTELLCRMYIYWYRNWPSFAGKRLGYVPMDYLWLACDPENGVKHEVPILLQALVQALEEHPSSGGDPEDFYTALVPTLGERGYPALRERLKASISQPDEPFVMPRIIGQAVAQIGKKGPASARAFALDLIKNRESVFRAAAMHVLKALPTREALDDLWEIHRQHVRALSESSDIESHLWYDLSISGLRACVQLMPQWLVEKIQRADPAVEPVSELAWLLWSLDLPEAKDLWHQLKVTLFEKVSPDKPRSLIRCIGRFQDGEELPRLREWFKCDEDFAQPAAFSVLCQLDPDAALAVVEELADEKAVLTRSLWLPQLLLRLPQRARERLLTVARQRPDSCDYLARIYAGHENLIDVATLEFYLATLEAELAKCRDRIVVNDVPGLGNRLRLVANIHRLDLLRVVEARANAPLEKLLLEMAQNRLPRLGFSKDPVFEMIYAVLCKIGGEGLTELINSELASDNDLLRRRGIADALRRPDDRTRALLCRISQSHKLEGNPPRPVEQGKALQALAALGDDQAVIRGILRWGQSVPRSILSYRASQEPIEIIGLCEVMNLCIRDNAVNANSALITASFSRNRKYIPLIQTILERASPEGQAAWCAANALITLGDTSEKLVELLIRLLATPKNRSWAMRWLSHIGNSKALSVLMQHLETAATTIFAEDDWRLALHLFQREETRGRASELIVDRIRAGNDPWLKISGWHLAILPELGLDTAYDLLLEEAFSSDPIVPERVIGAIKGLWKLDPDASLHAAELALKRLPQHVKDPLPALLIELAGEQAMDVLCRHALKEESTATRWSIARALRLVSNLERLCQRIQEMASAPDRLSREVAVEISGWQPPGCMQDTLEMLAREDFANTVSQKAREALQRQDEQRWVEELMEEFQTSSTQRRWNLLTSIIELGDPFLLASRRDRLCVGRILGDATEAYWQFANVKIEERKPILLEQATRLDRKP